MINWQLSKQDIRWPVSPDRTAGSSVDPSRSSTFLKSSADKLPVSNDRRFKSIFSNDSYGICCVYVTLVPHCQDFDFKMTSDAKIQPLFLKNKGGEDLFLPWSRVGHALRPIFVFWLVKMWQVSSCGNLCSILKVVYFNSWSWQSFVSTCDVFNCLNLFPLDVKNKIQLRSRVFCYPWLVCLLGFWLRKASLVKIG